jgi:hypothetical protein
MEGQLIEGLNNTYIVSAVVNNLIILEVFPKENLTSLSDEDYKKLCIADALNKYNKEGSIK